MIWVINTRFNVLLACLLFACVYEVCSTYIVRWLEYLAPDVTVQIGGFDPWDILAYFVGSALGWWLLLLQKNWLLRWLPRAQELDAQDVAARKTASPKQKKPRKKRREG